MKRMKLWVLSLAVAAAPGFAGPSFAAGEPKLPAPAVTPAPAAANAPQPVPAADTAEAAKRAHQADIETARARCTALLKSVVAVTIAHDPIEEGECGALAPVELVSVGKNPEVALSPPAIVTCELAVALAGWVKADVQPLAKQHLGRDVVRIETMSSYSCRLAYGRKKGGLSEHAKANALDIRGFVTATGQTAYVLEGWGMTSAEIAAAADAATKEQAAREVAAALAKTAADAQAKAQAAAAKPGGPAAGAVPNPLAAATTLVDGLPKPSIGSTGLGLAPPSRLGGPKKKAAVAAPVPEAAYVSPDSGTATATSQFLRAVHASACRRFGTTLGPEANAAHRNHLHVDLAERKSKPICE